jgi:hypothetical protein
MKTTRWIAAFLLTNLLAAAAVAVQDGPAPQAEVLSEGHRCPICTLDQTG